jgi:DNA mismatch endonuclease (patch repair protein)
MSQVRAKDTKPELAVRHLLHSLGYRYRLHRRDLPGTPDIVFVSRKKVMFVHGCFWHRHEGCRLASTPRNNSNFWLEKFEKNKQRDANNIKALHELGWKVHLVWQCQLRDRQSLEKDLLSFLAE